MASLRMIAVLVLAALFAVATAQDNGMVVPASDGEGQGQPTGWLDYIFQFTVAGDDGTLSTWNVEIDIPMDMPSPPPDAWTQSEIEQEETGDDFAMATPETEEDAATDEDDAPNCGMFLQTAFDVCAEQRCDFSCHHHHHHDHDHEEDQEGEAEEDVVPEAEAAAPPPPTEEEWEEDEHDHKFRHHGGHHHHHRRGPRIARQCRDAVKDARDKMDQCGAQTFQSSEDSGFVFAYSDALDALEEANEGMCACGFFCSHPALSLGLSAFLIFAMWAIVYTKLYRCVVARNRERLGAVKARFVAVLLVPGALVVLVGLCVVMSYVVAFPMISIPLLLALFFGLSARRMRLRRLRMRQQQQRLPQAVTINLPTVRSVPANGRAATMPTATLVAFPAGRPVKGDVVVSAIVV